MKTDVCVSMFVKSEHSQKYIFSKICLFCNFLSTLGNQHQICPQEYGNKIKSMPNRGWRLALINEHQQAGAELGQAQYKIR